MRVHLDLISVEKRPVIPINYNHLLSRAILKTLAPAEQKLERLLRGQGVKGQINRRFKMFTFSGLRFYGPRWELQDGLFRFQEPAQAELIISFPHDEEFLCEHVVPLFRDNELTLGVRQINAEIHMQVRDVSVHPFPELTAGVYKTLAPITVSRKTKTDIRYLPPRHPEMSAMLTANLLEKHELLTGERVSPDEIEIRVDEDYLRRNPNPTKVIKLNEGKPDETRIRGFVAPIQISGPPEVLRTAFAVGIGERNHLGFGIIDGPLPSRRRTA
jgi:CRISPR-associated endoribonuclease Cas6